MEYIIYRNKVSKSLSSVLFNCFKFPTFPQSLNLLDGEDKSNTHYKSNRSKGLTYMYSTREISMEISSDIIGILEDSTGLCFSDSINSKCLPFCSYEDGGVIEAHRGVQKDNDLNKYQGYVAVLMLSQRGEDFEEGRFYLNSKAECSPCGKIVTNDLHLDRFYPELNAGDMILFDNTHYVHGVETTRVFSTHNKKMRLTCSFRTN